ncbi:TPA: Mov34/MPN/PAD-1 family protein [Vibrio parahaemolyticus]|uniref:Mov34/MPN/PAD-1 family protein n=1 Tax=Vibrio parahaemolyticus TaxID=670 RepID=UPI001869D1C2|nr:Mov34/MPN/PAD-1 family protein [Vibrio parahaemolyticus]MBE4173693.1 peptidase [Vibrio parahaemolyticus]MCR9757229.1 Mov34/MPN/PAD-1 family protein [Vibrio parahaemolyticus]
MHELVLVAEDGTKVLIEAGAMSPTLKYRQFETSSKEAGGIFIGEYRGDDLRILSVTEPGELDQRSRCRFGRRSPHHQEAANKAWLSSGSIQTHIGDWHTHPQDYPLPSSLDYSEWRNNLPQRPVLLAILGRKANWYGMWNGEFFINVTEYEC